MKKAKKIVMISLIIIIQVIIVYLYGISSYKVNAEAELIEENKEEDSIDLIKLKQQSFSAASIPSQYDLRASNLYGFSNHGNINITSEKQVSGTCWDFASLMALQTTVARKKNSSTYPVFSKAHIDYLASKYSGKKYGNSRDIGEGGTFNRVLGYFKNNDGPVLNNKCFYTLYNGNYYNERVTISGTAYYNSTEAAKKTATTLMDKMQPDYYVHEVISFPGVYIEGPSATSIIGSKKMTYTSNGKIVSESEMKELRNAIKQHIITNGGLYCSIRTHHYFIGANLGSPYNTLDGKYSQYDDGSIKAGVEVDGEKTGGHAITIIGWDDNYSKNKFNAKNSKGEIVHPTSNGAWLTLNNGGDDMWENGCQWISYEDYSVQANLNGYLSVDTTKKEYTYQFEGTKAYNKMKSLCSDYEDGVTCTDNTKTVKGVDIIFNDIKALNFSNTELSNADLKNVLKYKLPKLTRFQADSNNLSDLSPLYNNRETLETISLWNNKISNVGVFSAMENIKSLDLSYNNISDVTSLKLDEYDSIDLMGQEITVNVDANTTEYTYPSIFKEAKKSSSVLYSKSGLDFSGCKENSNGTGVILTSNKATIVINSGNAMGTELTITRTGNTYLLGDVDGNGKINIRDIIKIRKNIANSTKWSLTNSEKTRADVNKDGKINIRDIIKIRKYIAASSSSAIAAKHPNWLW